MAAKSTKRKTERQHERPPWGFEWYIHSDGSRLLTRSAAIVYRALLADLEQADTVALTGERLAVAKQALRAALHLEDEIKERDWRMVRALNAPGSETRRLRAMRREFAGRQGRGRGAVIDIAAAVRDWRMLTDPAPVVDAEGCTWLPWTLGYYGLVPACTQHSSDQVDDWRCPECRTWRTRATADRVALLGRVMGKDPRVLAMQALKKVHGFATLQAVEKALRRAGIKNLPPAGRPARGQ